MSNDHKPHLFLGKVFTTQQFTTTQRGHSSEMYPRNRIQHGEKLLHELNEIWKSHDMESASRIQHDLPISEGEYLTFTSAQNENLQLSSLDSNGIRLLNVKYDAEKQEESATVFIPENKINGFVKKIEEYITQNVIQKGIDTGKPKNQPLVNKIEYIYRSTIVDLWNGPLNTIPADQQIWCELWLDTEEVSAADVVETLNKISAVFGIQKVHGYHSFPQRTIAVVKINYHQLVELVKSFPFIAEIRKAEELNNFWLNEITVNRENYIGDAVSNLNFNKANNYITILDSGINHAHLLLSPILSDTDKHAADNTWPLGDSGGHGTKMAGVAAYGNLNSILENNTLLDINHQLESVKIIPTQGNEFHQYSFVMLDGVSTAQIANPKYNRIYCMAVTAENQNDFGKPSSWSAILDGLIFGDNDNDKKLFVVSVGNVREEEDWKIYPESNLNLAVESPAQSWNSIGIGAYTSKVYPDRSTLALKDELSPFSRTSSSFENSWPIKPDVVFEGGNIEGLANGEMLRGDDLEILTTSHNVVTNNFSTINATSAATAFAANFLAKLRDTYQDAWPETCRALMIHSAKWTKAMMDQFGFDINRKSSEALKLLRIFGYGVPNLERAISSKSNYLTFISEQNLQPYENKGGIRTKDIHYYEFPWPKEILENLGDTQTTLRITLSYFIEPNPGDKGYATNYSYQSAALRFVLINPGEDFDNFRLRTNRVNQDDLREVLGLNKNEKLDNSLMGTEKGSDRWALGAENTFKGSIHSNFWTGTAAEIASCNILAVYPQASGWWKQLKGKKKYDQNLRYSLVVSLETPENSQDIYTPIANKVAVEGLVKIKV